MLGREAEACQYIPFVRASDDRIYPEEGWEGDGDTIEIVVIMDGTRVNCKKPSH
jgi:hypothetical protein